MIQLKCPHCNQRLLLSIRKSKINGRTRQVKVKAAIVTKLTLNEQKRFCGFIDGLIDHCDEYDLNRIMLLHKLKQEIKNT